jgi:HEAT repeat protein
MNSRKWQVALGTALAVAMLAGGVLSPATSAQEDMDEAALIAILGSDAEWLEKQAACRSLRRIGTEKSVPALAALLADEKLSHMARYALEPMPYCEVDEALREALGTTKGLPKVGVITSIGVRRDAEAVSLLAPLAEDPSADVARAAIGALGRIATPKAVKTLMDSRDAVPDPVHPALIEGLLVAAEDLYENGKSKQAVKIYEELLKPSWPMHARVGAFRGLVYTQMERSPKRLVDALGGDEPLFRDVAAQLVAETCGEDMTLACAKALPTLPTDGQVALLRGLATRGDAAARPAVAKAVSSADAQVKLAAVKALGALGDKADVTTLAGLLVSDDADIAEAAKTSLAVMQGEDIDTAIAGSVAGAAPTVHAQLLETLMNRRAEQAVPLSVEALADGDTSVREAGLRVLALLGGNAEAPAVVSALANAQDSSERSAVEKALTAICSRDGETVLPIVLQAMNGASSESRVVLLRGLARIGGPKALDTVLAAINGDDTEAGNEAVRLLSNWGTLDAAPHLAKLAEGKDETRQVLGLRGYVRLARVEPSIEKRAVMLAKAMKLTKRPDEKKLVLGAWGTVPTEGSLKALRPHLKNESVRNEAAQAIIAVAAELGKKGEDNKARSIEALRAVVEKCKDEEIRRGAQKALADLK